MTSLYYFRELAEELGKVAQSNKDSTSAIFIKEVAADGHGEALYEIILDDSPDIRGRSYDQSIFDELRNLKLPTFRSLEEAVKPRTLGKQRSIPFWANDWRKKHKR